MRATIFEHTESTTNKPGFISISDEVSGLYATIRHRGGNSAATIQVDLDVLEAMGEAILSYVKDRKPGKIEKPKAAK